MLNVATPLTAERGIVPDTFAGDEVMVIDAVEVFTRLPKASCTATNTEGTGVVLPPSEPLLTGCDVVVCPCTVVVKASWLGGPGFTVSFCVTVEENAPLPATVIVGEQAFVSL